MLIPYIMKQNGSIVLLVDGVQHIIHDSHIHYKPIVDSIKADDEVSLRCYLTLPNAIATFTDGKFSVYGDELYHEGKVIHNAISKRIISMLNEGFKVKPFLLFLENLLQNPSQTSINELYLFLDACDLPITEDGHFLAYKMVNSNYRDLYSNTMDNSVGSRPFMDRTDVDPDRNCTCSRGLHFASLEYVKSGYGNGARGDHLMVLKINPKDVVAIPADYNNSKGRAWTYQVVGELEWTQTIPANYTENYREDEGSYDDLGWDSPDDEDDETPAISKDNSLPVNAKLTKEQVFEILDLFEAGASVTAVASEYDISTRTAARVRDGESYNSYYEDWAEARF